jgi:S1-C subfamily serine protease
MCAGVSSCGILEMTGGTAPPRPGTVAKSTGRALSDRAIYAGIAPTVVDVSSSLRYDAETADGTGFVINAATALILTNNHVIRDATEVTVTLTSTGRRYPARIVGTDVPADVAVLQLQGAAGANGPVIPGLVAAPVGDSEAITAGAPVLAIGNQAGAGGPPAVTTGVISGLGQTIQANDAGSGFTETLHNMLQTSARIAPGDSGGPLADRAGQVIGVNTAAGSGAGDRSGYAIPINDALTAARLIAAGQPAPGVTMGTHGFLGVVLAGPGGAHPGGAHPGGAHPGGTHPGGAHPGATNPRAPTGRASAPPACAPTIAAAAVSAPAPSSHPGALVAGVLCGTGAAAAGLAAGDVITSVNGHRITSPGALTALVSARQPGTSVTVTWISASGHPRSRQARLDTAPAVLCGGYPPIPQLTGVFWLSPSLSSPWPRIMALPRISDSLAGRQPPEPRPAASAVSYAAIRGITNGTRDDHDASGRPATSPWPRMPPQLSPATDRHALS